MKTKFVLVFVFIAISQSAFAQQGDVTKMSNFRLAGYIARDLFAVTRSCSWAISKIVIDGVDDTLKVSEGKEWSQTGPIVKKELSDAFDRALALAVSSDCKNAVLLTKDVVIEGISRTPALVQSAVDYAKTIEIVKKPEVQAAQPAQPNQPAQPPRSSGNN